MPTPRKTSPRRRDGVVEALLFAAFAAQLLLLVALVLHGPDKDGGSSRGLVGAVGRFSASLVYGCFGVLSYLLVALGLWTTSLRLARKELTAPRWRIAGFVLFLIGGCTVVHQFFPASRMGGPETSVFGYEPGGALGALTFSLFQPAIGALGTFLVAVVLLCTGVAFATDWLLYEMAYSVVRRAGGLFVVVKRFWPEPVFAGAGSAAAATSGKSDRSAKKSAAEDASSLRTATLAPSASGPLVGPGAATLVLPGDDDDDVDVDEVVEIPAAAETPAGAAADTPATLIEDPVLLVPADLVPPRLPSEETPSKPSPKAARKAAADDAADDAADIEDDGTNDEADLAAANAAPVPEPPKPVLRVKLDPPATTGKAFRIDGMRVERPRTDGEFEFPSPQLLERPKPRNLKVLEQAIQSNAEVLQRTLAEFKIEGQVVAFQQGPVVTMLEVALAPGTKVTKIHSLADDLAMALKAEAVRIVAPIPGKSTVGVEIPNPVRDDVRMLTILESPEFQAAKQAVPMLLGCAADGRPLVEDLASMPHLLIAGSTGSGKSVCINTILLSILMTRSPDEVRLILIDPKQVELAFFTDIPHLLSPVVTDMKRASAVLEWALDKMEERYDLLRRFEVRNIASYNELGEKAILARAKELDMDGEVVQVKLPYIVIVVDELADLMLAVGKDVETAITRLAQKSRAVGIHVILATQRPSTDVITGLIKANMPTRIAFKVASKIDSRVILDQNGAEKLLGMGDMLYMPPRSSTIARAQGTYASDREVKRIVGFLRERYKQEFSEELVSLSTAPLLDASDKDALYDEAVRIVLNEQRGSASLLQRALAIGYTRASRLLDLMRAEGVVGVYKGSKASEVQMTLEEYEARVAAQGDSRPARGDEDDGE